MGYLMDKCECQSNVIDYLLAEVKKRIKMQYKKDAAKQQRVFDRILKEVKKLDY